MPTSSGRVPPFELNASRRCLLRFVSALEYTIQIASRQDELRLMLSIAVRGSGLIAGLLTESDSATQWGVARRPGPSRAR